MLILDELAGEEVMKGCKLCKWWTSGVSSLQRDELTHYLNIGLAFQSMFSCAFVLVLFFPTLSLKRQDQLNQTWAEAVMTLWILRLKLSLP